MKSGDDIEIQIHVKTMHHVDWVQVLNGRVGDKEIKIQNKGFQKEFFESIKNLMFV